jgi:hypothetical protein
VCTIEHLLRESSFEEEVFDRLQLPALLEDKELTGCTFRGLKGEASIWEGVRLEDCVAMV